MIALPEDVSLSLLRGIGAFIRATPAPELPSQVRRFRGFRDAALRPHRDKILALLDDDAARRMIVEWLDEDKPRLGKGDSENLRIAAERADGWGEALRGRGSEPAIPTDNGGDRSGAALEREKAKTRRAREDLKRQRERHAHELAVERGRHATLSAQMEELRAELERERAAKLEALEAAEAAQRSADRELRRARSDAAKAEAAAAKAVAAVQDLRRELQQQRDGKGQDATERSAPVRRAPRSKPRAGPRKPLKTPRGLLSDAPETLDGWLDRDDVYLLVDGYNVTKKAYGGVELERQRDRLVDQLNTLTARKKISGTVVFDGSDVPATGRPRRRGSVKVVFSKDQEIADDRIVSILEDLPPTPVVLVTNDRELQDRGSALGATVATSDQLLALLL